MNFNLDSTLSSHINSFVVDKTDSVKNINYDKKIDSSAFKLIIKNILAIKSCLFETENNLEYAVSS